MTDYRTTLSTLPSFDTIIDVRTPLEFADDHIPGAVNCPVLTNEERHEVGLLYARSPFDARHLGAAMVARNIAQMLDKPPFRDRPKNWRPLVYCWRGGMRSLSLVTWLNLIGWRAGQLAGGYKTWRRHVVDALVSLPPDLNFRVIAGATGSAKTRFLQALAQRGEQTLDLEGLAAHKGSVLGGLPTQAQPSQKLFETRLYETLKNFDPSRVVYVEAESRKIGGIALPNALIETMRTAACVEIRATVAARLRYLLNDYAYLGDAPEKLVSDLERLHGFIDNETLNRWQQLAREQHLPPLFDELITRHYDPLYARSQYKHFIHLKDAVVLPTDDLSETSIATMAERLKSPGRE
jgi:tRNA 2-selenouridine synthase